MQPPTTIYTITHNHPQPPKSYPRKPELVTISHADTETSVDFESDM